VALKRLAMTLSPAALASQPAGSSEADGLGSSLGVEQPTSRAARQRSRRVFMGLLCRSGDREQLEGVEDHEALGALVRIR
jgi:hypothetical protein